MLTVFLNKDNKHMISSLSCYGITIDITRHDIQTIRWTLRGRNYDDYLCDAIIHNRLLLFSSDGEIIINMK